MRILVAEDEAAIADFIDHGLSAEGYAVTVASRGDDALALALSEDFGLVVLDRMLPGLDGIAVLEALRAAKPELGVIMLTARTQIDDRVEGLDAGAIDYMTKPFAFDELAARVRAHLRTPSQTRSTRLEAYGIELDLLTRRASGTASRSLCRPRSSICSRTFCATPRTCSPASRSSAPCGATRTTRAPTSSRST